MAYLILCPHLTATEDLALFCVLVGLTRAGAGTGVQRGAAALVVGGLMLNPAFGPAQGVRPSLLFFAKLGLMALVLPQNVDLEAQNRGQSGEEHD